MIDVLMAAALQKTGNRTSEQRRRSTTAQASGAVVRDGQRASHDWAGGASQ